MDKKCVPTLLPLIQYRKIFTSAGSFLKLALYRRWWLKLVDLLTMYICHSISPPRFEVFGGSIPSILRPTSWCIVSIQLLVTNLILWFLTNATRQMQAGKLPFRYIHVHVNVYMSTFKALYVRMYVCLSVL